MADHSSTLVFGDARISVRTSVCTSDRGEVYATATFTEQYAPGVTLIHNDPAVLAAALRQAADDIDVQASAARYADEAVTV